MDRNARNALHQRQTRIGRQAKATQAVEFFNVLTSPQLLEATEALLPEHRERLYPPTVALSIFMRRTLEADGSCQKARAAFAPAGIPRRAHARRSGRPGRAPAQQAARVTRKSLRA